jgi:hypothetical protein
VGGADDAGGVGGKSPSAIGSGRSSMGRSSDLGLPAAVKMIVPRPITDTHMQILDVEVTQDSH